MKRITYNSPVILTYTLVSLLALGLNALTGGWTNAHLFSVYRCSLLDPLAYIRLFGHVIGHSSFAHYTGNFMMILVLGPALEEKYGSRRLLVFMAVTALVIGAVQMALFSGGILGASGIVFLFIVLSSCTSIKEGSIPLTLILVLVIYLGQQIVAGVFSQDNISQLAHILGGICGAIFGLAVPAKGRSKA